MQRILTLALAVAMIAGAASAAHTPVPPYKTDATGRCHDSTGSFVTKSLCAAPAAPAKTCVKGKLCGNTCIAKTEVCHK
jgi:hypothetical protein